MSKLIPVEIFIGPDHLEGGAIAAIEDPNDDRYILVSEHGRGPRGTKRGFITADHWVEWGQRKLAGAGVQWAEAEVELVGHHYGSTDARGGIRVITTMRTRR